LIADSSYTRAEYSSKMGWGHGVIEDHLSWARRLGVETLICTHHEPTRGDAVLEAMFAAALAGCGYTPGVAGAPNVLLAREGLELAV